MKYITTLSRSLVSSLADALEAVDVAFRAHINGATLPSMNNVSAMPLLDGRVDQLRARFEGVARKCGIDLYDQELSRELYSRAYSEIDRREMDRVVSLKMKREAQQRREQEAHELREMQDEIKRQGAFELAIVG